ncbi:hypothetical protein LQ564_23315 [Massilia sp. G4R7]|uniref:6-phosphogluconate dehydrogenase n=1 Tax=Massilia phyllostachyos TaxID=2898585 RepID=A0ABS8QBY4_9BURK|nr:hypothetical protein [Massilia phyllostachyos]MCD2519235.1 hypothetical protein [Massilia phyllostachyos]
MPKTMPKRATALLLSVLAAIIVLFALYTWFTLSWSYSEGERAGYLQKFSKKGWLCKTWEGEILLSSMPGAIPERFAFTVRDEAVVKQLQNAMGQRVQISYEQHVGVPTSCFGETEYFASKAVTGPVNPVGANQGL